MENIKGKLLKDSEGDHRSNLYWDGKLLDSTDELNAWKSTLTDLSGFEVPRSYVPGNFGEVQSLQMVSVILLLRGLDTSFI